MLKYFRPKIKSRHGTHDVLRKYGSFPLFPFKSVIRLGSTTQFHDNRVELNSIESINNSADKLFMKKNFEENKVKTASWTTAPTIEQVKQNENLLHIFNEDIAEFGFPIIAKHRLGSKGKGNYKLDSQEQFDIWFEKRKNRISEYIFEKFYNYTREYRLHITEEGCFYTCRKMLKKDTPNEHKWYRNDEHCVWIMEDNENFDKPKNWRNIITHSVKALQATKLDFGAVDVKVQSATNKKGEQRKSPEFIIIEINSAPSFGEVTAVKYLQILPKLLLNKNYKKKK